MKPEISVILPVYNSEKYIEKTIESILNQSFSNFEIIIIDDGSSDRTGEICREKLKKDERIKYFYQDNQGICYTRNKGIRLASGKYCAFCDHDDIYDANLLKDNYKLAIQYHADIVKFGRKLYFEGKVYHTKFASSDVYTINRENLKREFPALSEGPLLLYIWDSIISTDFLKKNKIFFDESFKSGEEDRNFMFTCLENFPNITVNPKCYYNHYIRGTNTTANFSKNRVDAVIKSASHEKKIVNLLGVGKDYWDPQIVNYFKLYLNELMKSKNLNFVNLAENAGKFQTEFDFENLKLNNLKKMGVKKFLIGSMAKFKFNHMLLLLLFLKKSFSKNK